jgi:hypothetical protein
VLAASLGREPRPLVRLAQDCRDHCFNVGHDLGANAFFVALAITSGSLANEGLYHWVGEERCRRLLREDAGPKNAPAPDGWGRYLVAGREVTFFLEWDRGTESVDRLLRKSANYIRYFVKRVAADYSHILFVFPSVTKELAYHKGLAKQLPADERCCVFWTTTVNRLEVFSPREPIWWKVSRRRTRHDTAGALPSPTDEVHSAADRVPLYGLASQPASDHSVSSCIGKPGWWERRLSGGQA